MSVNIIFIYCYSEIKVRKLSVMSDRLQILLYNNNVDLFKERNAVCLVLSTIIDNISRLPCAKLNKNLLTYIFRKKNNLLSGIKRILSTE